jgi:uncharacterized membrane protein
MLKNYIGIQSRLLYNQIKSSGIQSRQLRFFFKAIKSVVIQLRFHMIYKMSLDIQKSTDFRGFFCAMDFVRLFS